MVTMIEVRPNSRLMRWKAFVRRTARRADNLRIRSPAQPRLHRDLFENRAQLLSSTRIIRPSSSIRIRSARSGMRLLWVTSRVVVPRPSPMRFRRTTTSAALSLSSAAESSSAKTNAGLGTSARHGDPQLLPARPVGGQIGRAIRQADKTKRMDCRRFGGLVRQPAMHLQTHHHVLRGGKTFVEVMRLEDEP